MALAMCFLLSFALCSTVDKKCTAAFDFFYPQNIAKLSPYLPHPAHTYYPGYPQVYPQFKASRCGTSE